MTGMMGVKDVLYVKLNEEFIPLMPGPSGGDKILQFNRLFDGMWEAMRGSWWVMTVGESQPDPGKVIATFEEDPEDEEMF